MKLWLKFSLIFIVTFGAGLAIAGEICHNFLLRNANEAVLQQAHLMLETTLSTRTYTSQQIGPLLQNLSLRDRAFHPQQVPGFAAMENFRYLHANFPEYSYKEATLNPTNLRDRPTDWEADIIREFRDDPNRRELSTERDTPTGRSLVLARPILATPACLQCHSTPSAAPVSMIKAYGSVNGFGWKNGEAIGAQIISVPVALPMHMADVAFSALMFSLLGLGVVVLLSLNTTIYFLVIRPITQMARMADATSKGDIESAELAAKGNDEISVLARSFNRMQRSLLSAMQMLGR